MRENRLSGSEGGARFNPLLLPLSVAFHVFMSTRWPAALGTHLLRCR